MIIKITSHKINKDGTAVLSLAKGLAQEDRHALLDMEGKSLELREQVEASSEYDRGLQEGIRIGIEKVYQAALALKAEDV